jgi:hypothetical protein
MTSYEVEGFPGCVVSTWSEWSLCSHTCLDSPDARPFQWRMRWVRSLDPGATCPPLYESRPCEGVVLEPCDLQDCVMGEWGEWAACSYWGTYDCGEGTTFRSRPIVTHPKGNGAKPCGNQIEFGTCGMRAQGCNTATICILSPWTPWHAPGDPTLNCSEACGGGYQERTRTASGTCNPPPVLYEIQPCNTAPCSTPCELAHAHNPVGQCSHSCGPLGTQRWVREVIAEATGSAPPCPTLEERTQIRACNRFPCPIVEPPVVVTPEPAPPEGGGGDEGTASDSPSSSPDPNGPTIIFDPAQYALSTATATTTTPAPAPQVTQTVTTQEETVPGETVVASGVSLPDWFPKTNADKAKWIGGGAAVAVLIVLVASWAMSSPDPPALPPQLEALARQTKLPIWEGEGA